MKYTVLYFIFMINFIYVSIAADSYTIFSGETAKVWSDDPNRIEPDREVQLLRDFLVWSSPQLGQFPEKEKNLKKLAHNISYLIKHSEKGLPTKVYLGVVGGEDGRWEYPNTGYFHPTKNPKGLAVNFTEKFIQVLDYLEYIKNQSETPQDVIDGLNIYLLGVHAHESRHGLDYANGPVRDLIALEMGDTYKKWKGLVPKKYIEEEIKVLVDDYEHSGFHLNYLYYQGHEDKIMKTAEYLDEMRKNQPELFVDFGFKDSKGTLRNFSLLRELERNDFVSYYLKDDVSISKTVAAAGGQFDFSMVGSTINAYMYGQYVPLEAVWELFELNNSIEKHGLNGSSAKVKAKKRFDEIVAKWNLYMDPSTPNSKAEALLGDYAILRDAKDRFALETKRFNQNCCM